MRKTSHKKHNSSAPPLISSSSTAPESQNQLFKSNLKDHVEREQELYGKGYWLALEAKMKEIEKEVESGQRSARSLLKFSYKASIRSGKFKYKYKKSKRVAEAEDLEEQKFILEQALTYDVLVQVMSKWEDDERTSKSLAHETSPPR